MSIPMNGAAIAVVPVTAGAAYQALCRALQECDPDAAKAIGASPMGGALCWLAGRYGVTLQDPIAAFELCKQLERLVRVGGVGR